MANLDPGRLSKLLEMAAHPSANEGEALNSLRALRAVLDRAGRSLSDLVLDSGEAGPRQSEEEQRSRLLDRLRSENQQLRFENARLRRANAQIRGLKAELQALRAASGDADCGDAVTGMDVRPVRITDALIAVYDLLAVWRSIADIAERLGPEPGSSGVKRIVRVLDERGLLRCVEAWPTRYCIRPDGELSESAKAFRSLIEEARAPE